MKKGFKNVDIPGLPWVIAAIAIVTAVVLTVNMCGVREAERQPLPGAQRTPVFSASIPEPQRTALSIQEGISHAVAMVRPAVVAIAAPSPRGGAAQDSGLTYIQPYTGDVEPIGSGVIVDQRGYVLSTYQSVGTAKRVKMTVFTAGRKEYEADVLEVDSGTDLVLLKIRSNDTFPTALLGNSDTIEVGDIVLALGSPFGFSKTVTMGIVSAHRRSLTINGVRYPDMLQTDAVINRGNNGGPLVNVKGEVIGINAAYFVPGKHFTGIGFAVPINDAVRIFKR